MKTKWRVLALMTGAQAGASVVQQALGSLSPTFVATFALSKTQLGAMFTAMMVGSAAFTALAGVLTDRWGELRLLLLSGALMAGALLALTLVHAYWWIVAMIAVFGAAYAASTPAGGRAILSWFDRDRGLAMGIRQTGVPIGGTLGAIMLPLVAHWGGYGAAFVFAAALIIVTTLIAYVGYPGSREERAAPQSFAALARGMRVLARDPRLIGVTLTCMILVSIQLALNAFVTVTAVTVVGTSAALGAAALALAQLSAAVGRLWWGFASDRLFGGDRQLPFAIICALASLSAATLGVVGHGMVATLVIATAVLGFSGAGWNGLMAAALAEVGGVERAASAIGLALTAVFGTSALAPLAFGALADHFSLHEAWLLTAALALVGMVPALWLRLRLRKRGAPAEG